MPFSSRKSPTHRSTLWYALLLAIPCALVHGGCGSSRQPSSTQTGEAGESFVVLATGRFAGTPQETPEDNFITAIGYREGELLVGTKRGLKFAKFTGTGTEAGKGEFKEITDSVNQAMEAHPPLKKPVLSINRSPDGKSFHVCSEEGYATFDGRNFTSESTGRTTAMIHYENALWCGRASGLERQFGQDWVRVKAGCIKEDFNSSTASRIHCFAIDGKERLWIGSEFGLYFYDKKDPQKWGQHFYGDYQNMEQSTVVNEKGNCSLAGNFINGLCYDKQMDRLLIATTTGLGLYDGDKTWEMIQGDHEVLTSEGGGIHRVPKKGNISVSSTDFTCVVSTDNWIFVGSSAGLLRFDKSLISKDPAKALTLFNTENGLPRDPVTSLHCVEDLNILFVGTENGIAAMGPLKKPTTAK